MQIADLLAIRERKRARARQLGNATNFDTVRMYFLHWLTKQRTLMTAEEIARKIDLTFPVKVGNRIKLARPTSRTILNWTNWFKEKDERCLDVFPHVKYESLGLLNCYVLFCNPANDEFWRVVPFVNHVSYLTEINGRPALLVQYSIPPRHLTDFKKLWTLARSRGHFSEHFVYPLRTSLTIYSPFHKVIDENGDLDFSLVRASDYAYFDNLLRDRLKHPPKLEIHESIRKNPFIIPVILTYFRELWSSRMVWNEIKQHFGERVWDFLPNIRKKTDDVGEKRVQITLREIEQNNDSLIQQIRLVYNPFYYGKHFTTYLFGDFKSREHIYKFMRMVSRICLESHVWISANKNSTLAKVVILTDHKHLMNILSSKIGPYLNENSNQPLRVFWKDNILGEQRIFSKPIRRKFAKLDYATLFDPERCEWNYDHRKYMRGLKNPGTVQ